MKYHNNDTVYLSALSVIKGVVHLQIKIVSSFSNMSVFIWQQISDQ